MWAAGTLYMWLALQQYVSLQCCATPVHFQIQLTSVSICDSRHKIVPWLLLYHFKLPRLTVVGLFQSPTKICFYSYFHSLSKGPLEWKASCFYCMLFTSLTLENFIEIHTSLLKTIIFQCSLHLWTEAYTPCSLSSAVTGTGTQYSAVPCHWHSGILVGLFFF